MELHNRDDLEREFAAKLGKLWAGQRRELTRLLGDPPDPAKIPPEWWEKARRDNDGALALLLYLILIQSADQHLFLIHKNDRIFSRLAGLGRTPALLQQLEPGLAQAAKAEAGRLADKINARNQQAVAKAAEEGEATKDLTKRLFGESPVARQAVTGTTWGRATGGEHAVRMTVGLSPHDLWLVVYGSGIEDKRVCPTCSFLNDTGRQTWSRFYPFGPPAHDSCRCEIQFAFERQAPAQPLVPAGV